MRNLLTLLLLTFFYIGKIQAQTPETKVFIAGEEGHKSYRIPAIIQLPQGDLLAFAEGRVLGSGDFGDINIVLKRSTDNGKTWSPLQVVVDYENLQAGNPAPVVDKMDPAYPQGRIFLFYNTGNNHEYEVRMKKGYREVWYITSLDGGQTWSTPVNITAQTHKIQQPDVNPAYNFPEDWRTYANTPGHAMQIENGPYKGRIFVAANHSEGDAKKDFTDYVAHGYYTDDHGKTFKISENVPLWGSNESTAAEISGGRLMMNSRDQNGEKRYRIVSISEDGGSTWSKSDHDTNLPDPVNQGSLLYLGRLKGKDHIAFCNANHQTRRDNLTVRISNDDGKSWFKNLVIAKSPEGYKGSAFSAYSDLVKIDSKRIGVLYEKDNYQSIVFTTVKWR